MKRITIYKKVLAKPKSKDGVLGLLEKLFQFAPKNFIKNLLRVLLYSELIKGVVNAQSLNMESKIDPEIWGNLTYQDVAATSPDLPIKACEGHFVSADSYAFPSRFGGIQPALVGNPGLIHALVDPLASLLKNSVDCLGEGEHSVVLLEPDKAAILPRRNLVDRVNNYTYADHFASETRKYCTDDAFPIVEKIDQHYKALCANAWVEFLGQVCHELSDPAYVAALDGKPVLIAKTSDAVVAVRDAYQGLVQSFDDKTCESIDFNGVAAQKIEDGGGEGSRYAIKLSEGDNGEYGKIDDYLTTMIAQCLRPASDDLAAIVSIVLENCVPPTETSTSVSQTLTSATKTSTSVTATHTEPDSTLSSPTSSVSSSQNDFTTERSKVSTEGEEVTLSPSEADRFPEEVIWATVGSIGIVGLVLFYIAARFEKPFQPAAPTDDDLTMENAMMGFRNDINTSLLTPNIDQVIKVCTREGQDIPDEFEGKDCYYLKNGKLYLGQGLEEEQPISNTLSSSSSFHALTDPEKSILTTYYMTQQRENAGNRIAETEFGESDSPPIEVVVPNDRAV